MFLDRFAKKYGTNKIIGEDSFAAVVNWEFSPVEPMTLVRIGFIATNLVTCGKGNGNSLLAKSDLEQLKSKNNINVTKVIHDDMVRARSVSTRLYAQDGAIDLEQCDELMGSFLLRAMLTLTRKGKAGPEKKDFTMEQVKSIFIQDATEMSNLSADEIVPGWAQRTAEGPALASQQQDGPIMLRDGQEENAAYVLRQRGFCVGSLTVEKGQAKSLFRILDVEGKDPTKAMVVVEEVKTFGGQLLTAKVKLDVFVKGWLLYQGELQRVIPQDAISSVAALKTADRCRCQVFDALHAYEEHHKANIVSYAIQPTCVVSASDATKGSLTLAPLTDLDRIRGCKAPGAVEVSMPKGVKMYLTAPTKPSKDMLGKPEQLNKILFAPFWCVLNHTNGPKAFPRHKDH